MELKVYGYYGKPVIVFPAQGGRFYEYEDFKMIEAVAKFIEEGKIKVFTVDSLDNQSWANQGAHPADRARRHEDYDRYISEEVIPFARQKCGNTEQKFLATGCSMGAYHAANFFFRHPDIFDAVIAISGLYQLGMFVGDYMDDNVYFNSPLAYLPDLNDPWYIEQYKKSDIIICCGQGAWEDAMLADTRALKYILEEKGIPAWIDIWGHDVNHDWPWWRKMMPYFLEQLNLPGYTPETSVAMQPEQVTGEGNNE
jgi:esterase/lipase superfamily enzyme